MEDTFLSTGQVARLLDLSPRTLEKWRVTGGGPTYVKLGRRVVYRLSDLELWAALQSRRSTRDAGEVR